MELTERAAEGAAAPREKPDGEKGGPENIHIHFLQVGYFLIVTVTVLIGGVCMWLYLVWVVLLYGKICLVALRLV